VGSDRIEQRPIPPTDEEEERILWTLACTVPLGLVGIALYVNAVGQLLGFDAFVDRPGLVRDIQTSEAFRNAFRWPRFLNYLNILNVAIGSFYVVRYRGRGRVKLVGAAMALGFATTLLAMDRTLPFAAISWSFFTAELARTEGRGARRMLARVGLLALVTVVLFVTVGQILGKTLENNREADKYVLVPPEYRPLAMAYIYLTANIPAFQEFVRHTDPAHTKGSFLLLPAAKIVQLTVAPNIVIPEEVGDYYPVPFEFNAHTWLDVYWSDFGWVGVTFVPLMIGLGATLLFVRALERPTFRTTLLCGLGCYVLLNSVFVNKLVSTPMWEFAFIILVMSWGLRSPAPAPPGRPPAPDRAMEAT
jgi:hypothetical protein